MKYLIYKTSAHPIKHDHREISFEDSFKNGTLYGITNFNLIPNIINSLIK